MGKLAYSQTTYIISKDTLTCLNEQELDIVIGTFIDLKSCEERFDTLSVAFDAAVEANNLLEKTVELQKDDLTALKVVVDSQGEEIKIKDKAIRKERNKSKVKGFLLYAITGVAVVSTVLLLIK